MNHSFAFYCALMLIVRIIQEKCEYHIIPKNGEKRKTISTF